MRWQDCYSTFRSCAHAATPRLDSQAILSAAPGSGCSGTPSKTGGNRNRTNAILSVRRCAPRRFGLSPKADAGKLWRSTIALDKRSAKSFIRINEKIRAREIRVIDENGEQMGILPPFEALKVARERGLDLVEVSPNAVPPVCRIQDYGRFLYEKGKERPGRQEKTESHRRQGV